MEDSAAIADMEAVTVTAMESIGIVVSSVVWLDVALLGLALMVDVLVVEGVVTLKGVMRVGTVGAAGGAGRRRLVGLREEMVAA